MANRMFYGPRGSLQKEVVALYGKVAIGGTGAPTLSVGNSFGISSIVRNSAGNYSVTLDDKYSKFLCMQVVPLGTSSAAPIKFVVSEAVSSTGVIIFQMLNDAGSATDPGSGEVLYIEIKLANTSVV